LRESKNYEEKWFYHIFARIRPAENLSKNLQSRVWTTLCIYDDRYRVIWHPRSKGNLTFYAKTCAVYIVYVLLHTTRSLCRYHDRVYFQNQSIDTLESIYLF